MADRPNITGEFDESMRIDAPATQVFDFVSKVQNLPKYLPTTRKATAEQGGRVRVQGEAEGHSYDADGYSAGRPRAYAARVGSGRAPLQGQPRGHAAR